MSSRSPRESEIAVYVTRVSIRRCCSEARAATIGRFSVHARVAREVGLRPTTKLVAGAVANASISRLTTSGRLPTAPDRTSTRPECSATTSARLAHVSSMMPCGIVKRLPP